MNKLIYTLTVIFLTGCASMNAAVAPSAEILKDDFDNSTIVRQPAVNSSASISDAWHVLGFEWSTKYPNEVIIIAGLVMQNEIIREVEFKADSVIIENIRSNSTVTDHDMTIKQSSRRFVMPIAEFRKIAAASVVKMRVTRGLNNNAGTSTFGTADPSAIVSSRFKPFLAHIDSLSKK